MVCHVPSTINGESVELGDVKVALKEWDLPEK